jgi:S-adenosylmethionine:diacylglycerol 3-amino-3-carboxypropyl transferase
MWEDIDVSLSLLELRRGERVLAIASAGEAALAYAAAGADVLAVDLNPAQLHLARFKAALLDAGLVHDHLRLFGTGRHHNVPGVLGRLPKLPQATRRYWHHHADAFAENFHVQGPAGRPLRWVRGRVARAGLLPLVEDLALGRDLEAQRAAWRDQIAPALFTPALQASLRVVGFLRIFGVPSLQGAAVADHLPVLRERLRQVWSRTLLRDNPFHQLALFHRYVTAPSHLKASDMATAGRNAHRIAFRRQDIAHAALDGHWAAIDLLDSADWLAATQAERLFGLLRERLEPGGRLLVRTVRADIVPLARRAGFRLDERATEHATLAERTGLYRTTALLRAPD